MKKIITIISLILLSWSSQVKGQTSFSSHWLSAADSTGTDSTITGGTNGQCFSYAINYSAGAGINTYILA